MQGMAGLTGNRGLIRHNRIYQMPGAGNIQRSYDIGHLPIIEHRMAAQAILCHLLGMIMFLIQEYSGIADAMAALLPVSKFTGMAATAVIHSPQGLFFCQANIVMALLCEVVKDTFAILPQGMPRVGRTAVTILTGDIAMHRVGPSHI